MRGVQNILSFALALLLCASLVTLVLPSTASAAPEQRTLGEVHVTVPDGWMYDATDPEALVLGAADQSVVMMMTLIDPMDLEPALMALDEQIAAMVTDLEPVGEPLETEFNGLRSVLMVGQGNIEGTTVEVGLALIETPDGRVLLVMSLSDAAALDTQVDTMRTVLETLEPIS